MQLSLGKEVTDGSRGERAAELPTGSLGVDGGHAGEVRGQGFGLESIDQAIHELRLGGAVSCHLQSECRTELLMAGEHGEEDEQRGHDGERESRGSDGKMRHQWWTRRQDRNLNQGLGEGRRYVPPCRGEPTTIKQ